MNIEDIVFNIYLLLDIKHVIICSQINKLFYKVSKNKIIWKNLIVECQKSIADYDKFSKNLSYRDVYVKYYNIKKMISKLEESVSVNDLYNKRSFGTFET